jgi:hypothetical protein
LSGSRILEVAELDFHLEPYHWPFAAERAGEIQSHWEERSKAQPTLFNGRVLLLGRHAFETRADGKIVLRGAYFETDFAAFLAWRDFGFPGAEVCNGFSMAALRGSDGAFLLGDRVDLLASLTRELEEETGIAARETTYGAGWIVVDAPPRIACLKIMSLGVPAATGKARIEEFLARDPRAELSAVHVVSVDDAVPAGTLDFIRDFLSYGFAQRSVG